MTVESEEEKKARRAISGWLTKQINTVEQKLVLPPPPTYPDVRARVLVALESLNNRLDAINGAMRKSYSTTPGRQFVKFYLKGGNAFDCILNPNGPAATHYGGGDSDWDTQVVIDPWAPLPLQNAIYGLVEEVVTDELINTGVEISEAVGDFANVTQAEWAANPVIEGKDYSQYSLNYEKPQTLRRVFDRERLGLWTNDRRPVSDPQNNHLDEIPGILLNDSIRPFVLHRLGYTWRIELTPQGQRNANAFEIKRPALMELIDVTIPRRDTIEAVTVWEELHGPNPLVTVRSMPITVEGLDRTNGVQWYVTKDLPLPDIGYHTLENATMLCEIADGSSRHSNKLDRRFIRLRKIWQNGQQAEFKAALSALIGVADIDALKPLENQRVTREIRINAANLENQIAGDEAYSKLRKMMDHVANQTDAPNSGFEPDGKVSPATREDFRKGRVNVGEWIAAAQRSLSRLVVRPGSTAFSDDLLLIDFLQDNKYLDAPEIGFSGVYRAAVVRVADREALDALAAALRGGIARLGPMEIKSWSYDAPRINGVAYEQTMVVFNNSKAYAYITLTTATKGEAPFQTNPQNRDIAFASLPEVAMQRKVAAMLIRDYLIRKVISKQYDALKSLLPSV